MDSVNKGRRFFLHILPNIFQCHHFSAAKFLLMDEKGIRRINAAVTAIGDEAVEYVTARSDKKQTVQFADILSASYARGDDGDTLKNEEDERNG